MAFSFQKAPKIKYFCLTIICHFATVLRLAKLLCVLPRRPQRGVSARSARLTEGRGAPAGHAANSRTARRARRQCTGAPACHVCAVSRVWSYVPCRLSHSTPWPQSELSGVCHHEDTSDRPRQWTRQHHYSFYQYQEGMKRISRKISHS